MEEELEPIGNKNRINTCIYYTDLMTRLIFSLTILIVLNGCSAQEKQPVDSPPINMDGYWEYESSQFFEDHDGCPAVEYHYDPWAWGSHVLIKNDSISLLRYPFQFYRTYQLEQFGDSIGIHFDDTIKKFFVQKDSLGGLFLQFRDIPASNCPSRAEANYKSFTPDPEIIHKLFRDSINYEPLVGKWWHIRRYITSEDGSPALALQYPKGMPDSIFVSNDMINDDIKQPFIELTLEGRSVKLFFRNPDKYSFSLIPALESDNKLFSRFYFQLEDDQKHWGNSNFEVIYYNH